MGRMTHKDLSKLSSRIKELEAESRTAGASNSGGASTSSSSSASRDNERTAGGRRDPPLPRIAEGETVSSGPGNDIATTEAAVSASNADETRDLEGAPAEDSKHDHGPKRGHGRPRCAPCALL